MNTTNGPAKPIRASFPSLPEGVARRPPRKCAGANVEQYADLVEPIDAVKRFDHDVIRVREFVR